MNHSIDELVTSLSRILNTSTVSNLGGFEEEYGEQAVGGPTSGRCFATFGNALIVRDTTRGHEQIGRVLATLRDVLRVDRSAPQAESKPDSPARRRFIRRSDPGSRGSRRTGRVARRTWRRPIFRVSQSAELRRSVWRRGRAQ